jgi:putative chitinase
MRAKEFIEVEEGWKDLAAAGALATGLAFSGGAHAKAPHQDTSKAHAVQAQHIKHQQKPAVDPLSTKVQPLVQVKKVDPQTAYNILWRQAVKSGMTDPHELAQFLAQCSAETGQFQHMGEIGRPTQLSKKYKNSTGNEGKKDALKYVGRGFIQLTGKGNYMDAGKDLHGDANHYVKNPDLAADAEEAAKIAVWFWNKNVKPRVKDFSDTAAVTRAINGSMAPKLEIHKRHNIFGTYLASVKDYMSKTKKG